MTSEFSYRNVIDVMRNTRVVVSHNFNILSYSPGKVEENIPCTEVHVLATAFKFPEMAFVIRLKSRDVCQELIDALIVHRDDVWPVAK